MTTISTRALPAGSTRSLSPPSLPRRSVVVAVLAGAALLGGFGLTTSAVRLPDLSAVHLDVAAAALARAAHAVDGPARPAQGTARSAAGDLASCWRQAHRLELDPSSCASSAVR